MLVAATASEIATIQSMGFTTALDEEQTRQHRKLDLLASRDWTPTPPYNCYRTVEELYAYGAALASVYPTLAEWTDVRDPGRRASGSLTATICASCA